ncbi:hypothetical protein RHMOL_Rhmol07G0308000 [Rhododendron molle]|uniref:Uncharacterized protein n=1 Tax=Rhododendron molle TaxID=49168 RepID=A0ACC0N6T0_RHOML|nr:hypothetical protein RHMOL_Rhmol07G0308000 [Rhododendron molle]
MEDYIINWVVIGVLSWAATFLLVRKILFPHQSFDFCNRIVSTIHASLAVALSSLSVQDWRCPVCPMASKSSPWQMQTMAVSLAYMIYDLGCGLFEKQFKIDNSIHHLVSIIGFGAGLAYEKAMALGLQLVSAFWFYKIARMVKYKLAKRTTSKELAKAE